MARMARVFLDQSQANKPKQSYFTFDKHLKIDLKFKVSFFMFSSWLVNSMICGTTFILEVRHHLVCFFTTGLC